MKAPKRIDLNLDQVDALLKRVESGSLKDSDFEVIKAMAETIHLLSQAVDEKATSIPPAADCGCCLAQVLKRQKMYLTIQLRTDPNVPLKTNLMAQMKMPKKQRIAKIKNEKVMVETAQPIIPELTKS
jgi:hypothetical protein